MPKESKYSFRFLTSKDEDEVMELVKNTYNYSNEFLMWKYRLNPDFDPSFAVVAVNNERVVGCAYWLPRYLKISNSTVFRAAQGTDLAVHPNHRGHGIGRTLIAFENKIVENKKIILNYGFIRPDLVKRIHRPQIGLVALPTSTSVYKKYLNCSIIRERVSLLNAIIGSNRKLGAKLTEMDVRILFRLRGFPPFLIKIGPDKIHIEEDDLASPNLKIESDFTLLISIFRNKNRVFNVIKALLMGKIKISGNILCVAKLYTIFNYLRRAHMIDSFFR